MLRKRTLLANRSTSNVWFAPPATTSSPIHRSGRARAAWSNICFFHRRLDKELFFYFWLLQPFWTTLSLSQAAISILTI